MFTVSLCLLEVWRTRNFMLVYGICICHHNHLSDHLYDKYHTVKHARNGFNCDMESILDHCK